MEIKYWLVKSEPDVFSIEDLKKSKNQTTAWNGVRNYQARNYMRDEMKPKDLVLFYHSSCTVPGVAGVAEVVKPAYPDFTSWDKKSEYYDPSSSAENPRWFMVDLKLVTAFKNIVTLEQIKKCKELNQMTLVKKGNRLSVFPIEKNHFDLILKLTKG